MSVAPALLCQSRRIALFYDVLAVLQPPYGERGVGKGIFGFLSTREARLLHLVSSILCVDLKSARVVRPGDAHHGRAAEAAREHGRCQLLLADDRRRAPRNTQGLPHARARLGAVVKRRVGWLLPLPLLRDGRAGIKRNSRARAPVGCWCAHKRGAGVHKWRKRWPAGRGH